MQFKFITVSLRIVTAILRYAYSHLVKIKRNITKKCISKKAIPIRSIVITILTISLRITIEILKYDYP